MGARPSSSAVVEDTPPVSLAPWPQGCAPFGYAADSDELALRHAGAEILWSLQDLPVLFGLS
jgi:hypothetical protein